MTECVIAAGAGGQGIMLLGKVLAEAAMRENKHVTWLPAYGAEVRGGAAYCMVVISDKEIGTPYVTQADSLIIMNEPSLKKFKERIKNKGLLIINSSLVDLSKKINASKKEFPFTDMAAGLGNIKVANMIALGFYVAEKKIVDINTIFKAIEKIAPQDEKDLIEINQQAVREGVKLKDVQG